MRREFERKMPQSADAEASVLAAMLISRDAIAYAAENLKEEFFYLNAHREIFKAVLGLYEKNSEVDPVTLTEQLKKDSTLEEVGGLPFIYEIATAVPTAENIGFHSAIVREKHILRQMIVRCTEIIEEAYQPVEDIDAFVDRAEEKILQIQQNKIKSDFTPVSPMIHEMMDDLDKRCKEGGDILGLPTGFKDLDNFLGGLQNSDFIVVAGRPSMGKTAFCLNLAANIAGITLGHPARVPVAVFSLEMSKQQVIQRLICAEAGVSLRNIRIARLSETDWIKITKGANELYSAPIFVDDSTSISPTEVRAKARRIFKAEKIGLFIIDYLQLMTTGKSEKNRQEEVSRISRSLKALAKELDVPVMAVSQLSRAVEARQDQKPRLSDLRESGAIEQDADQVIFLFQPERAGIEESEGLTEIMIAKNRNGPVGSIDLYFQKEFTKFTNLERFRGEER